MTSCDPVWEAGSVQFIVLVLKYNEITMQLPLVQFRKHIIQH